MYRNFDWDGPLAFVKEAANLSDQVMQNVSPERGDGAVRQWFSKDFSEAAD